MRNSQPITNNEKRLSGGQAQSSGDFNQHDISIANLSSHCMKQARTKVEKFHPLNSVPAFMQNLVEGQQK